MMTYIAGAADVLLDDGRRIWCPPAYVASVRGFPFKVFEATATRPYWTAGPKCPAGHCGPDLTEAECEAFVPKAPMHYKLEVVHEAGQNPHWVIRGLPDKVSSYDEWPASHDEPDTVLHLVGMYHGCDTPESVFQGVYRAIYDHHQVTEGIYSLPDGAVIESSPCEVNKFMSYRTSAGKLRIPAMRFKVVSFHVTGECLE